MVSSSIEMPAYTVGGVLVLPAGIAHVPKSGEAINAARLPMQHGTGVYSCVATLSAAYLNGIVI